MLVAAPPANAQELEPRSYSNTPVGLNFALGGYNFTQGNVAFNPVLPISGADVDIHSGTFGYVRAVDIAGLSGKIAVVVPYASLSGTAALAGVPQSRKITGFADPKFRLSVNLFGAPAVTLEDYQRYRQDLIIGATVEVSPPLGQYDPEKLVNLGTNRWSVKTELGASKALGPFTFEGILGATFYTANNAFLGQGKLTQEPLIAARGHAIYQFAPWLWASFDATYYSAGRISIDDVPGDRFGNVRLGLTASMTLNRHASVKVFGSTGVYSRGGSDFDTVGLAFQVRWGGGL